MQTLLHVLPVSRCDKWWYLYRRGSVSYAGSVSSQSECRPPSNRPTTILVPQTDPSPRCRQVNLIFILSGAPKAHEVSYENNRGASKQFPLWNSLSVTLQNRRSFFSGTYKLPPFSLREAASLFSCPYKLPIFYPLCFDIHASDGGCGGRGYFLLLTNHRPAPTLSGSRLLLCFPTK